MYILKIPAQLNIVVFRYFLPVPKIYSLRHVYHRSSTLAVYIKTQPKKLKLIIAKKQRLKDA